MIPVALNHLAHVRASHLLPRLIADMLPARNFFENEQADFIAAIQKMPRLRIMRGANKVEMQFFFQNIGVFALRAGRHGLPDIRKRLMPVQAAQFDRPAVQPEAVRRKFGGAKADARLIHVFDCAVVGFDGHVKRIKRGIVKLP